MTDHTIGYAEAAAIKAIPQLLQRLNIAYTTLRTIIFTDNENVYNAQFIAKPHAL